MTTPKCYVNTNYTKGYNKIRELMTLRCAKLRPRVFDEENTTLTVFYKKNTENETRKAYLLVWLTPSNEFLTALLILPCLILFSFFYLENLLEIKL